MNQDNNFMDSKTLWAILLVGVVWFGWQQYINKKYGEQKQTIESINQVQVQNQIKVSPSSGNIKQLETSNPDKKGSDSLEQKINYSNSSLKLEISSKGMSLKNIELTKFVGRDDKPVQFLGGENGLFSTIIGGELVDFNLKKDSENSYIGEADLNGIKVVKMMTFSDNYNVKIETKIDSSQNAIPSVSMTFEEVVKKVETGSIFSPPTETQEIIVLNQEGEKDFNLAKEKDGINTTVNQTFLASINGHYFSSAFVDKSEIIPSFSIDHKTNSPFIKGSLNYNLINNDHKNLVLSGIGYFGPKDTSILDSVDPMLSKIVRFGFFSAIAKPLLTTMKWLNSIVGNWGWSIILLTLLVRMIVMPLHIMSFKSMKAMQKVQPLIQNIKEKYKDDPMSLNRETMALMKKHKVNPMGGCLPMLLQIPVFFALYRVFSESLDLYKSPFIFWIHDLSLKDPFYVLPVLMAAVMYLQQKMTPSTMDPTQAKIMQFMPLIFSLMMVSLPSALTLYMFVSTFFGILQQYMFLKDKKNSVELAK